MPNSKVKVFKGSSSKTPLIHSSKKGFSSFESFFSVSRVEVEQLGRSTELERQKNFNPLETDLHTLFHSCPQSCEIPDHLKSIEAACGLILI